MSSKFATITPRRSEAIGVRCGALVTTFALAVGPMALVPSRADAAASVEPVADGQGDPDEQRALELYNNGRSLFDEGNYAAAITAFEAAYEISKEANLLYNISLSYDRLENYDQAIYYLDQYRALAPAAEHPTLDERRDSLVKRRQRAAEEAELETARKAKEAESDPSEAEPAGEPAAPGGPDNSDAQQRVFTTGPIVLTVIAIAGLGAGIGMGVASQNAADNARDRCQDGDMGANLCLPTFADDAQSSRNLATGANVAFAVGGAAALGAIVWIAVNASRRAKQQRTAVAPSLNRHHAGLVLQTRF